MEGGIMADLRASGLGGVPKGATADRPSSPSIGDVFYNGTLGCLEIYTSQGWVVSSAPPAIPTSVVATNQGTGRAFNNGQASVAFDAGSGGGLITDYVVTPSPATSPTTFTGSSSPITVTGLQSSTQYTYTVQGRNNFGTSLSSAASAEVTATTVPQAPTLTAVAGNTNAIITITPGATGGSAITQYTITSNPATTTQTTSNTTYTFTGLTNETSYTFTATATNANGTSIASAASNSITPAAPFTVNYLVVAGGGGGGKSASGRPGGGGAGGLRSSHTATGGGGTLESALSLSTVTNYTVTVGSGAPGSTNRFSVPGVGGNSVFNTITSNGGGSGGNNSDTQSEAKGANGGSGGGSGGSENGAVTTSGGTGTNNQGFNGGQGQHVPGDWAGGGGGGGAGDAGFPASKTSGNSGRGGAGLSISITGSSVTYAGGGGGAGDGSSPANSVGGAGGGGGGVYNGTGSAGTANTGGGGGGSGNNNNGANGGSGIVILRYPSSRTISVGAGLTSSTSTVGSDKVTTFTAGTGTISFS
jgi:hypothetical protein